MLDNWAKREGSSPQKLEFTEFVHIHVLMGRVAPEGAQKGVEIRELGGLLFQILYFQPSLGME